MPGILAADRSGAIVDKSERRCLATFHRGAGVLCGAFLSAAFPGLLKFLVPGFEDGFATTKQFVLRSDVTDSGVQAHGVVMVNKLATYSQGSKGASWAEWPAL